jgi:hypothetical protein
MATTWALARRHDTHRGIWSKYLMGCKDSAVTDTERVDPVPATPASNPVPVAAALPAPGWYTDPGDPRRDRWWTGSEWATITARTPRSMYGPAFARSMRAGLNKNARIGTVLARVALLLWLVSTLPLRLSETAFASTAVLGLLPIIIAIAVAGIVFSARGLAASKMLGGRILCLYSIYAACAAIALPAVSLGFAVFVR